MRRAQDNGYTLYYVPSLIVYHKIANRLNEEFINMYALKIGTSEAQFDAQHNKLKFSLKLILSLLRIIVFYLYGKGNHGPCKRVSFKIQRFHGEGYLRKSLLMLNKRRRENYPSWLKAL